MDAHDGPDISLRSPADPQREIQVAEAARLLAAKRLAGETAGDTAAPLLAEIAQLAESKSCESLEQQALSPQYQCREGCSHCCHMRIHVTVVEIAALVRFIRSQFSSTEVEALKDRLREADAKTHGLDDEAHGLAGTKCPMLRDHRCSVYEARPLECRGYVSMDVDACRSAAVNYSGWNVPIDHQRYAVFKSAQAGLLTAMVVNGLPFQLLELNSALRIALENPSALDQCFSGDRVFDQASLPLSDPEASALRPWSPASEVWESPQNSD